MQEAKRPVAVGFMFSLGHSTIVVLGSAAIVGTTFALQHKVEAFNAIGALVGTLISTLFPFGIAFVNLAVLRSVYSTLKRVRAGERYAYEDIDLLLANRGLLTRLFRPLFGMITRSWHMYPLGFCLDLASTRQRRLGLLGISAAEPLKDYLSPLWLGVPKANSKALSQFDDQ